MRAMDKRFLLKPRKRLGRMRRKRRLGLIVPLGEGIAGKSKGEAGEHKKQ